MLLNCGVGRARERERIMGGKKGKGREVIGNLWLKKDCRGLSRNAAGNPGFPPLVPVTAESFSGCL